MGLLEAIFKKKPLVVKGNQKFETITGYQPRWNPWDGCLYENDLVRNAIDTRARHIGKLKVDIVGNDKIKNRLKHSPNGWQTWSQFLYRLSTILDVRNTAFIVPTFDKYGDFDGVFPVIPTDYELIEYDGIPYLRFKFRNGKYGCVELMHVGIMTKFQYQSDFFGESNSALDKAMDLIQIQNQGISEGVKNGATYRFMATLTNFSTDDDLKKERLAFSRDNLESGSGLLLFPHTYKDIKQIESNPYVPDADQMKAIDSKVFRYFGVNSEVLENRAYGDAWSAFYEGAVEPFAIQFSEVMTKMLFTPLEQSYGSKVFASSNRLQYATTKEKLEVTNSMSDRGQMNRDEVREVWNLPPLPNGEGQEYIIRGEYKNATDQIVGGDEDGE